MNNLEVRRKPGRKGVLTEERLQRVVEVFWKRQKKEATPTNRQIAAELGVSQRTIVYWMYTKRKELNL